MKRAGARGAEAVAGVVMIHGRGGSGSDILSLLSSAGLPGVAAVAPEAPGGSWWPTSFLAPSSQVEPHVQRGLAAVAEAVAALAAEGLARDRIWLLGFSQGACLALETFARAGAGLAGVMAFSGGLVGTGDAEGAAEEAIYGAVPKRFDYPGTREGARVWLSVHERDPHIPLKRVQDSAAVLTALGASVETRVYPGAGHGVMQDDVGVMRARLNR
jgi:phospholipase/carboxylesterase